MAEPISIQQLKDASEDAISLAEFINKPANVMIPRRLAADINSLQYYLDYMSSYAQHSYETYDEMVANEPNLSENVSVFVTNDTDTTKNGIYTYNGTTFVRGEYQPENAAKDYVESKLGGLQVFNGKVRAQDVSTEDGSTQEVKNTGFQNELDSLWDKANAVMYITDFESPVAAQAAAVSSNRKVYIPDGVYTTNTKPDITKFYGQGSILDTTTGRSYSAIQKGYLTLEMFGAVGDGIVDDSDAIIDCANFAKGTNYKIQGESQIGYHLTKQTFIYNDFDVSNIIFDTTNIDAEAGSYYLSVAPNIAREDITTSMIGVTGLTEGSGRLTGLPSGLIGKYLHFSSDTVVLTERYNDGGVGIPYYKNTVVRVLDKLGNISPKLDMDIDLSTDIKVYKTRTLRRIKVKIGAIGTYGAGAISKGFIANSRNSVDIEIASIADNAAKFKTLFSNSGCDIALKGSGYSGADYDGEGYNILLYKCCDINLLGVGTTGSRAGVDGRHCSNVTFDNCVMDTAGSHWANNLVINNSTIGIVKFAGRDLTLKNSRIIQAISISAGVAYCSGKLTVDNVTCDGENLVYGNRGTEWVFSTARKMFDEVSINDITMTGTSNPAGGYLIFAIRGTLDPAGIYLLPKKITIKDIHFTDPNIVTTIKPLEVGFNRYKDDPAFPRHYDYRIENITHAGRRGTKTPYVYINNRGQDAELYTASRLNIDMIIKNCGKVVWYSDFNVIKSLVIEDCEIASFRTISTLTQGDISSLADFRNCIFKHDTTLGANHVSLINAPIKLLFKLCHFASAIPINANAAAWRYFFNSTIEANVPNESIPADFKAACKKITIYSEYGEAIPYT